MGPRHELRGYLWTGMRLVILLSVAVGWVGSGWAQESPPLEGETPTGGSVKIDYMHQPGGSHQAFLLTRENSTMFTNKAPLAPAEGVWGELIPFNPIDACGPLEASPHTKSVNGQLQFATTGTNPHVVALVARGNCSFEDKFDLVDNVPNVVGLLMYDFEDGDSLSNDIEISTFRPSTIPGFLIEWKLGRELQSAVEKMHAANAAADGSAGDPQWIKVTLRHAGLSGPIVNILEFTLVIVIALLVIAFSASVYMHYHIFRLQQRLGQQRLNEARGAIAIDEDFLEKLLVRKYRKTSAAPADLPSPPRENGDGAGVSYPRMRESLMPGNALAPLEYLEAVENAQNPANETCPICLDDFSEGESLNELPCGHWYHIGCIHPWLQHRSPLCPLCKTDVRDVFIVLLKDDTGPEMPLTRWQQCKKWFHRWMCFCCLLTRPAETAGPASAPPGRPDTPPQPGEPMQEVRVLAGGPPVDVTVGTNYAGENKE